MPTLKERLQEVMTSAKWEYADLVRVSGESRSVVSQWLGKASKEIKSIGKMEAAERIEQASGFAALWVAKGKGPKMVAQPVQVPPPPPDATPSGVFDRITPDERAFLEDYRWLTDEDKARYTVEIRAKAQEMKRFIASHMDKITGLSKGSQDPK